MRNRSRRVLPFETNNNNNNNNQNVADFLKHEMIAVKAGRSIHVVRNFLRGCDAAENVGDINSMDNDDEDDDDDDCNDKDPQSEARRGGGGGGRENLENDGRKSPIFSLSESTTTTTTPTKTATVTLTTTKTTTTTSNGGHRRRSGKRRRRPEMALLQSSLAAKKEGNTEESLEEEKGGEEKKEKEEEKDEDRTLIFFIHGVGGSTQIWNEQMKFVSDAGYECAALDLIGHGRSAAPKNARDYVFDEILNDVIDVFLRVKRNKNVIVAHSYGCAFANVLAQSLGTPTVSNLVLFAGGSPGPLCPDDKLLRVPKSLYFCCNPCILMAFKKGAFHNYEASTRKKSFPLSKLAFQVSPMVLRHVMHGQVWPGGTTAFHASIRTPTLVVHGETDQLVSLAEDEEMFRVLPNAQLLVVRGAAHMAMLEKPDDVNYFIHTFISTTY